MDDCMGCIQRSMALVGQLRIRTNKVLKAQFRTTVNYEITVEFGNTAPCGMRIIDDYGTSIRLNTGQMVQNC